MNSHHRRMRDIPRRELFKDERTIEPRQSCAAMLLTSINPEKAKFGGFGENSAVEKLLLIPLSAIRREFTRGKILRHILNKGLFFCELKIH